MYSSAHVRSLSPADVCNMAWFSVCQIGGTERHCDVCAQTLRECHYDGHLQGKKDKKRLEGRHRPANDKGIAVPPGTLSYIEQTALYNVVVLLYVYSL